MTSHAFAPRFDLSNVFAPSRAPFAEATTPEGVTESSFALMKSGPPVPAEEVESHVDAVEVTVRWGSQVLSVSHLASGKSFWVGEGADLALPDDVLGASRAPIVVARGGGAYVVVPAGARGSLATRGGEHETFASMAARGALPASRELEGAREIALTNGMNVTLEIGATRADGTSGEPITFEIGTVRAGKVAPVGFLAALAGGATGFVALSFVGHAAIVASLAMFMPAMSTDDSEAMDRDQMMLMQKFLNASAEREAEQPRELPGEEAAGGGSSGDAHRDESGAAGTTRPVTTQGRMAIRGTESTSALSPKQERELAANFGMIGILGSAAPADPNAPASPWADAAKGNEARSARGDMFSSSIDDAMGTGLGLSGTGEGAGGTGTGVGFDGRPGTVGGGGGGTGTWGFGPGDKGGHGTGHGPVTGGHVAKAPIVRQMALTSTGRLPAEVIQRIVRQNFGRFRVCYEAGLRSNPGLSGRVSTKFVIGRDGAVSTAMDAGSDLPDQKAVACVVSQFNSLSFPPPEGGIATVIYPIMLTPGE